MLRIIFETEDLGRVRVAPGPDPMWELILSLFRLRRPQGAIIFDTWRRQVRPAAPGSTRMLAALAPPTGYFADFLTPITSQGTLEAGLEALRATPSHRLRRDLTELSDEQRVPSWAGRMASGDQLILSELVFAARGYFDACLGPYWHRIQSRIDAERARLGRAIAANGLGEVLRTLHSTVHWRPPELRVNYPVDRELHLAGRGLTLMPSFFCWGRPTSFRAGDYQPILIYPIQHDVGWADPAPTRSLVPLLGRTRATLLESVAHGTFSTTELARRTAAALATVSQQTAILRVAGLITSRRHGQAILHSITPLGHALLNGHCCHA